MSNFCKNGSGEGKNIFFNQKHEKANFHDIAVEKSNSGICHNPDTRAIPGAWVILERSEGSARDASLRSSMTMPGVTQLSPVRGGTCNQLLTRYSCRKRYIVRHLCYVRFWTLPRACPIHIYNCPRVFFKIF